ncbi:MAG: GNAT family N-acetyltransferase [Candidatus Eisenbacteria bacterium]
MSSFTIRAVERGDREWAAALLAEHWGSSAIVTRGRTHDAGSLPGFVAVIDGERCGLVTYRVEGGTCEVVSLNSLREREGVGSALLLAVADEARRAGCSRFFLITTNDNLPAILLYKKRGFVIRAVHRNALDLSRLLKPRIPLAGLQGIPLRHEVELELPIAPPARDPGE